MTAALIVAALLLLPGSVLAQPPVGPPVVVDPTVPGQPGGTGATVDPRTPPPPTIPSAPAITLPAPTPSTDRPRSLFNIRPLVGVSEEWTDNFTQSARKPRSNLRSALSPGAIVVLDDPTLTGALMYTPLVFHDTFPDDFGVHHTIGARLSWAATPRLKVSSSASFAQSDDPARADTLNLQRGREKFTRTGASIGADYVFPLVAVTGSYRVSRFDGTDESTTSHAIAAGSTLTLSQINSLTGTYDYLISDTEAESGTTTTSATTGDSKVRGHQLTGTFSRELSSTIAAGLTGAYAWRHQTRLGREIDFSRWSLSIFNNYVLPQRIVIRGNLGIAQLSSTGQESDLLMTSSSNISYWLGPATLSLGIERGFSETFADGQDSGVVKTSGISASISYQFTPLLSATASAQYRENDSTGVGGTTGDRQEKTTGVTAQAIYQIFRWLTSTLEYSYATTTSTDPERGFTENRVRAALNALFD